MPDPPRMKDVIGGSTIQGKEKEAFSRSIVFVFSNCYFQKNLSVDVTNFDESHC